MSTCEAVEIDDASYAVERGMRRRVTDRTVHGV